MPILFAIGRVAFVLIFILSGAQTLLDIGGTAALIGPKLVIPAFAADTVKQIEATAGLPIAQILAILAGVIEVVSGLLIAFNIATRLASVLLIIFTIAATYYFHDFWNMSGAAANDNTIQAMKNLSIIGALLVFFVLGSWRPVAMNTEEAEAMRY